MGTCFHKRSILVLVSLKPAFWKAQTALIGHPAPVCCDWPLRACVGNEYRDVRKSYFCEEAKAGVRWGFYRAPAGTHTSSWITVTQQRGVRRRNIDWWVKGPICSMTLQMGAVCRAIAGQPSGRVKETHSAAARKTLNLERYIRSSVTKGNTQ